MKMRVTGSISRVTAVNSPSPTASQRTDPAKADVSVPGNAASMSQGGLPVGTQRDTHGVAQHALSHQVAAHQLRTSGLAKAASPRKADRRQGRALPGRAVPEGRIHRDEHELAKPLGGALLQQARHGGAVDQVLRRAALVVEAHHEGKQATHWTRLSCHRFRANEVRLQLSVWAYNLGNQDQELVADELATQIDEDRRSAGQARAEPKTVDPRPVNATRLHRRRSCAGFSAKRRGIRGSADVYFYRARAKMGILAKVREGRFVEPG